MSDKEIKEKTVTETNTKTGGNPPPAVDKNPPADKTTINQETTVGKPQVEEKTTIKQERSA